MCLFQNLIQIYKSNFHYKKSGNLPGAEALAKCRKPWQMDVCQEQNHQQICSSEMILPGVLLQNRIPNSEIMTYGRNKDTKIVTVRHNKEIIHSEIYI